MRVRELIDALAKLEPDAEVVIDFEEDDNRMFSLREVEPGDYIDFGNIGISCMWITREQAKEMADVNWREDCGYGHVCLRPGAAAVTP